MNLRTLTADQIETMSYNELIAVVQETNRPPGGLNSIQEIALRSFLSPQKRVLEIGTSTGVTAIELARLTRAAVTAIDINPTSLQVARQRAEQLSVSNYISFEQQDAMRLTYADETFDMVFCGNVTSLLVDREKALREYTRVLRLGGILAAIPMYYIKPPTEQLVRNVSAAIQVSITPMYKADWITFFQVPPLQPFWSRDYAFDALPLEAVQRYVDLILERPHLKDLQEQAMTSLRSVYSRYMQLFRENLAHMGFTILLLRKEAEYIDPELFTAHEIERP